MFEDRKRLGGTGFTVAWQKQKGAFMYGLYPDADAFFVELLKLPSDKRFGYELIRTDCQCRCYADVEFEGERDTEHTQVRRIE